MISTKPEINVLLWAAGVDYPPSACDGCDEDLLLQAVLRHRLTLRLLGRIDREGPGWATKSLIDGLKQQRRSIEKGIQSRLSELGRVAQLVGNLRPVMLKGPTTFLIAREIDYLKYSNDLDLLTNRPEELVYLLMKAGYEASDDYCRPHEYASLYKEGINIDVHRYFPVIDTSSVNKNIVPSANQGIWHGLNAANEHELTYEMFLTDARPVPSADQVLMAGPTMACLIACTHLFREYHHASVPLPIATIRLGELCEAYGMKNQESFNVQKLHLTARECHAEPSLAFTSLVAKALLGWSKVSEVPKQSSFFPHDAWLAGFTIVDERLGDVANLLIRNGSKPASKWIANLGLNQIALNEEGISAVLAINPLQNESALGRALVHGNPGKFTVQVSRSSEGLQVRTCHYESLLQRSVILVSSGDILYEVAVDSGSASAYTRKRRNTTVPKNAAGSQKWKAIIPTMVRKERDHIAIDLNIPWRLLGGVPSKGQLILLIGIRYEKSNSRITGIGDACLVPIAIT